MYVRALELIDFRGYGRVDVEFGPGPCVIVGRNGAGKTNLVEALHYVATLSSHRVATDAPLVRAGATRAIIRVAIVHQTRELLVELSIEPGKANRVRLGRAPLTRARDVLGALRLVLFAPEDLALVRGDPEQRRRFLDDLLIARQPRYAGVRADFERVLKQRNALLRTAYLARRAGGTRGGDLSTLDVWDTRLAKTGALLLAGRLELATALAPYVAQAYATVSGDPRAAGSDPRAAGSDPRAAGAPTARAGLGYAVSWDDARRAGRTSQVGGPVKAAAELAGATADELEIILGAAVRAARGSEIERGTTLVGPHRDDLTLAIGELPVKGYASHGESWSYALALRLAAFDLLRADGGDPVLVLDDVFAELDVGRRERLAEYVREASQVIVTCAVAADVPAELSGRRLLIEEGLVRRV